MRIRGLIFCLFFAAVFVTLSCNSGSQKGGDTVATVNNASIAADELKEDVVRYSRQNPTQKITRDIVEDRLKNMIEKKLMVQEAVKMKLHQNREFVEEIKNYWEQSLIRALVDAKIGELSSKLFVTDDEIRNEYDRMGFMPLIRAARAKTKPAADDIVKAMQEGRPPLDAQTIGPLYYENLKGSPLANAFDTNVGEVKAFVAGDEYIVIQVVKREKVPMPPLKDIYAQIRESLLQEKKQSAVKTWMQSVRKSAKININDKMLQGIAHE